MKYDWVIFDADDTLFNFDSFRGLQLMFSRRGINFSEQDFEQYQKENLALWQAYQQRKIGAEEVKFKRFEYWARKLNSTTSDLNHDFLNAMADTCALMPGAKDLIPNLCKKAKLAIITNGFAQLQKVRLERTKMKPYFEHLVVSEQVGFAKPNIEIFNYTFDLMNQPCKSKVLMVGDSLHSDILGGLNFGIDTCWVNHKNKSAPNHLKPSFTVTSLHELKALLLSS